MVVGEEGVSYHIRLIVTLNQISGIHNIVCAFTLLHTSVTLGER